METCLRGQVLQLFHRFYKNIFTQPHRRATVENIIQKKFGVFAFRKYI
jgi:hypothetical protein